MDYDEYETLPTNNFRDHMSAGAVAGVMEHCLMYPFDSVKTRMQSLAPQVKFNTIRETLVGMVKQEGTFRPYRGVGAVVVGAGPAHALYFSSYEYLKEKLYSKTSLPVYVVAGMSGAVATLLHDGIMVPSEVVKQRLQMYNSPYKSILDCIRRIYRQEGTRAFYRSYTTQLAMNIPFQSIHFMTYEIGQNLTNKEKTYNPRAHIISGGLAGGVAAAVTTPLDVIKTLLNTQQHRVSNMTEAFKTVYRLSGASGYFKGLQARIIYHVPSAAICWSTYEFMKYTFIMNYSLKCNDIAPSGFGSDRDLSSKINSGLLMVVPEVNLEAGLKSSSNEDSFVREGVVFEGAGGEKTGRRTKSDHNTASKIERTYTDNNDWNSRGTGIFTAALSHTRHRDDDNKSRAELLDVTHS